MIKKYDWKKEEVLQAGREIEALEETHSRPWRADRFLENKGAIRNGEDGTITVINVEAYEKFSALVEEVYKYFGRKDYAIKQRLASAVERGEGL